MTLTAEQKVAVLQKFVDSFAEDLLAVRTALGDSKTPEAAQRVLVGALNYALDMLDIFPDHYKGLGIADDAIVLRLAAKLAVAAGATDAALASLGKQADDVAAVFDQPSAPLRGAARPGEAGAFDQPSAPLRGGAFEDRAAKLEKLVEKFPDREVRGRTAAKILSHKDTRIMFEADVGREAKRHVAQKIDTSVEGPDRAIIELCKMIDHAIGKAGL